jgi:asparagine synthase (glutamine-hydrolysing)
VGGFFLYHTETPLDLQGLTRVFESKGFSRSLCVNLGSWRLLLYPKILASEPNTVHGIGTSFAFSIGTLSYRSLGRRDSLKRLLEDHSSGNLEQNELLGNFCIGLWDGRMLSLLPDRLNTQHLFTDSEFNCLSSSFLAVLAASPGPLRLNPIATHEKLATGYIVAPDTLVDGIHQLNHELFPRLEEMTGFKIVTSRPPPCERQEMHNQGFIASVHAQLEVLKDYFQRIRALAQESCAELGLSNGYDSRLLLAFSRSLPERIPLHSHYTQGVHESELSIARALASIAGNELTVVPTRRVEDLDDDRRREILKENLYFFDARCVHDMGAFSETYTPQYRIRVLKENRLSLNGLGGEIYRNVYHTPQGRFSWNDWQEYAAFYPFAKEACGSDELFGEMCLLRNRKISQRLEEDLAGQVDLHTIRRYYGLVRMPDNAGGVGNAYNQVAFFLTPFVEPLTLRESLKATPYIGAGGAYEAAMIHELDPRLAGVSSQYGHSFSSIPWRYALSAYVKSRIPLRLRAQRRRRHCGDPRQNPSAAAYRQLRSQSAVLREVEGVLRDAFPKSNWDLALCDDSQKRTSLYIGSFLKEFQGKLRF